MNLKELSPESIKEFSGSTIYNRGLEYYSSSKVNHVKYSIEESCITGKVSGSYNYKIKVEIEDNYDLNSQCSCPYDGYPCKHIVALLLEIFYHKDDYVKQAKLEHKEHLSLEDKVEKLSKEELVTIVKNAIKKYPDLKNELKIYLNKNSVSAIKDLKKQVEKMFASVDSKSPNDLKNIIKQIKNFMKTIKDSVPKIRVELKEKLLEEALTLYLEAIDDSDYEPSYDEYNDYFEVDTSYLEECIYNISKDLTTLIKENHQFIQERKKLVKLFSSYAIESNLALENLFDYAEELCYSQEDFSLIINEFTEDDLNNSHKRRIMTYFYGKAGKHDKQIHILESNLIYGSDYWDLVDYYIERENEEKALEIALKGITHAQGLKTELYDFIEKYYENKSDYNNLFQLLKLKINNKDFKYNNQIKDSTYLLLEKYYKDTNNYNSIKNLLLIRFDIDELVDFELYKDSKVNLNAKDFLEFENKIIAKIEKTLKITDKYSEFGDKYLKLKELARIYSFNDDFEKLFELIKDSIVLLEHYETKLLKEFPKEYLQKYTSHINKLIEQKSRTSYQNAIHYMKKVRYIYDELFRDSEKWTSYLNSVKGSNNKLRALLEELKNAHL